MQKEKYVNQNKQFMRHKIGMVLIFLLVVIFILIVIMALIENRRNKPEYILKLKIKEVLEKSGCTFIQMKNSNQKDYVYDIELIFKYNLYEEEVSQEDFYNQVIKNVADTLKYQNFRLIDKSKKENIEIKVICSNNQIQKIYINDKEDYFIYMNSQKNLDSFSQNDMIELRIESPELLECIQKQWSSDTNFGTRETIFQNYYIYFDEGIETRKINGEIYNIIFNKKYTKSVVNGFTVGTKRDIIESRYGKPIFENEDKSVIGYKNDDIYIFFEENQISIYRNTRQVNYDDFFELSNKFLSNSYTLLEFMNQLTYLWPDYEEYIYDANSVFISYPNKGIDIKINYDDTNGIILYNNLKISQEDMKEYLKNTEFIAELQTDNVYNAELRRIEKINNYQANCDRYREKYEAEDTKNRGEIYNYYMNFSANEDILGIYFISQNPDYPNCELNENIKSYIWAKDDFFIYSLEQKGIYYYDLKNQTKGVIITGEEDFEIKSLETGILSYDNEKIQINY